MIILYRLESFVQVLTGLIYIKSFEFTPYYNKGTFFKHLKDHWMIGERIRKYFKLIHTLLKKQIILKRQGYSTVLYRYISDN